MWYNYITFGLCGGVTVIFLGVIAYYTFALLLPHFDAEVWILVIAIVIGFLSSFVDVWCFDVFSYSRNPFTNILKAGCCCCYKLCCSGSSAYEQQTYLEQFRTHSISEHKITVDIINEEEEL